MPLAWPNRTSEILRVMHELMIRAGNQLRGTRADTLECRAAGSSRAISRRDKYPPVEHNPVL